MKQIRWTTDTISHYEECAEDFWEGTKDHDVSQNIEAFCSHLPNTSQRVLDFGCGPGRDVKALAKKGTQPIGLDGSATFCEMAREYSGAEIWQQNFISLSLPNNFFGGIFANASLFHIPKDTLPQVLRHFYNALVTSGIVFCSNPRGPDIEQVNGLRYGNYMDLDGWRDAFKTAGFIEVTHYYRPQNRPREEQPWLAMVWRKSERQ